MEFNPKAGGPIGLDETKKMIKSFKDKHPGLTQAYYFGAEHIRRTLDTPGCAGIRTFHGLDDKGNIVHILVPTDVNGNSILPSAKMLDIDSTFTERGQPCPPYCGEL